MSLQELKVNLNGTEKNILNVYFGVRFIEKFTKN